MPKFIKIIIIKIMVYYFIFINTIGNCMVDPDKPPPPPPPQQQIIIKEEKNILKSPIKKNGKKTLSYEGTLSISNCQKKQILKIKRQDSHFYKDNSFRKYLYKLKNTFSGLTRKKSFKRNKNKLVANKNIKKIYTITETEKTEYSKDNINDNFSANDDIVNNITTRTKQNKKHRNSVYQVQQYVKSMLPDIIDNLSISEESDDSDGIADNFFCEVIGNNSRRSLVLSYYQPEEDNISNESNYSNHYIAKVNEFFLNSATDAKIKYIGYYTPYYLRTNQDDMQDYLPISETDNSEYIHISIIIKQAIITKMLQQIGKATHKKMEIPLHDHYITGIHLAINIFTKLQLILVYDKDIMHSIKFIKDHGKAIELIAKTNNKHNTIYDDNYFFECFQIHKNILMGLHENISIFTDEDIYGLILTKIKIPEDDFLDLTKLKFMLYAFESAMPKQQTIADVKYIHNNYYIAMITILIANQKHTKFYKIEQNLTDIGSNVFELFAKHKLQELIVDNQHNNELANTNFMVIISLLFPYKNSLQSINIPEKNNVSTCKVTKKTNLNPQYYDIAPATVLNNNCEEQDVYDVPPSSLITNNYEEKDVYDVPPSALITNNYEEQNVYDVPPSALITNNYEEQNVYDVPPSALITNNYEEQIVYNVPKYALKKEVIVPKNNSSADSQDNLYINVAETATTNAPHDTPTKKVTSVSNISEIKDIANLIKDKQCIFKTTIPLFLIFNINHTKTD